MGVGDMKTVHLARGLTLPAAELATKVTGAFGIRGSGKSNLMSAVVEQLLDVGIQVIVLDPVGIHFSLRLAPDGKHPSPYKLAVLGGRHGDIVLQPTAGEVVGRALALSNDSCVLDISSMKKGERIRFSGAFFEAFYEGKKENPSPVLLCLEEAQRFAPQLMFKGSGQEQMLGAVEELAEQGRNFGAGLWLNSLRPQKVNKDVTSLMDLVFGFRLTGVHERKAVKEWLQEKGAEGRDEIDGELPSLQAGHAFVWSPAVFNIFGKYHIVQKTTYDAGATPLYARAKVKMRQLDIGVLEEQMRQLMEEAKMNDPRALKMRIAELERAAKLTPAPVVQKVGKTKTVHVSVFREADLRRIERLAEKLGNREDGLKELLTTVVDRVSQAQQAVVSSLDNLVTLGKRALQPVAPTVTTATVKTVKPSPPPIRGLVVDRRNGTPTPPPPPRQLMTLGDEPDDKMPEKCQRMLGALRQGEAMKLVSMPFRTVAIIAGVAPTSGTTSNRKGFLKNGGYITVEDDHVRLTDKGRAFPINVALPPDNPTELLNFWQQEIGTEKIAKMLEVVVQQGPITSAALAQAVGMEESGTFSNYKGALTGRGLILKQNNAYVAADVFTRQ
jgi:hypothetical protein